MLTALGEGVAGLKVGDLVGVSPVEAVLRLPLLPRRHDEPVPQHALLRLGNALSRTSRARSAMLVADASQCVKANGLSGEAAMAEPLAVTLHGTRRAGEMLGKSVLIVTGCGPIGVLSILSARRAGADSSWRRI